MLRETGAETMHTNPDDGDMTVGRPRALG
jgi:hypothetical protein